MAKNKGIARAARCRRAAEAYARQHALYPNDCTALDCKRDRGAEGKHLHEHPYAMLPARVRPAEWPEAIEDLLTVQQVQLLLGVITHEQLPEDTGKYEQVPV